MRKVTVLSKKNFKEWVNSEKVKNHLIISIESTDDCKKYWKEERGEDIDNTHILPPSDTVLNLEFDDLQKDEIYGGYTLKAISIKQAMEIVNFIDSHPDLDIIVHCTAGRSRSQGVGKFLTQYLGFTGNVDTESASFRVYHFLMIAWSVKHSEEINKDIIDSIKKTCMKFCGKWTEFGYLIGAIDAEEDFYYVVLNGEGKLGLSSCCNPIKDEILDNNINPNLGDNIKERMQKVAEGFVRECFKDKGVDIEENLITRDRVVYCL